MIALEVRDLAVEAGGRPVVARALVHLRAGDKMGVVGRNGAGKTSTLKVLAGEPSRAGGHVVRRGERRVPAAGPSPASQRTTR